LIESLQELKDLSYPEEDNSLDSQMSLKIINYFGR